MRYELSDFEWGAIKAIIRDRIEDGDRARAAAIASLPTALSLEYRGAVARHSRYLGTKVPSLKAQMIHATVA
jgi:hypothetical protein